MINSSFSSFGVIYSSNDDEWTPRALGSCQTLKWISGYLCLTFVLGIVLNGIVLYTVLTKKFVQAPVSTFIIALSGADLSHAVFGIPLPMTSNFACRWLYGKYLCYYEGFLAYFVGMIGLYLLTALSLNRYWLIVAPTKSKNPNYRSSYTLIALAIIGSFFWAITPVFGWSHYTLEGVLTSCSIRWQDRTLNVISYNIMMFLFGYIIPLCILLYCNIKIYLQIHLESQRDSLCKTYTTVNRIHHRKVIEKHVIRSIYLIIITFTTAWTPYAIVAFISSFFSPTLISPLGATLPAIFAKSSIYFNPLTLILTNTRFRRAFLNQKRQSFATYKSSSTNEKPHRLSPLVGTKL
ncbi:unnamed protein product [Adineta ricciae]|uniref:G-protein coupled receptors family 1 profile domain-containing protein n=1 Tax=Adineta ricciae TaxID=249248 RepID=A0A814FVX7_ADIRI|nr:unnamed protein product [Adineta ricciae]